MKSSMWGSNETKHFYSLDPSTILKAVDNLGFRSTGRCLALNSLENRVYEVEIERNEEDIKSPSDAFVIVKFYRPGRWTREQILEEHEFLLELKEAEIPVIAPIVINDSTLFEDTSNSLFYALFPKQGGRIPDEFSPDELMQLGRLMARMHQIGKKHKAVHRLTITPEIYGLANLEYLLNSEKIPRHLEKDYESVVKDICTEASKRFQNKFIQRIHGDCHKGNILSGREGFFLVDFDDMVMGPPVQDIWLILPGRDQDSMIDRDILLEGYSSMLDFDYSSLNLIEPLRALRFIHFSSWIGKRFEDESFKRAFPFYGTDRYWQEQIHDLRDQLNFF
jgi:Ser/Thr protein kinase RdoA (MazF antagonist)